MSFAHDENERPEALLREARRWVVLLHSGRVGEEDVAALTRWRMTSEAHRRAFAEANLRWDLARTAALSLAEKGAADPFDRAAGAVRRRPSRRALLLGGAAAASAAGAAVLIARPPLDLWPSPSELLADYRTQIGEQRKIALDGDVSVEMNARTSLVVGAARARLHEIELIAGEIAVTAGATPLVVVAGTGRVSASRATLDLRHDASETSVACLEGVVEVERLDARVQLAAGRRIVYGARGLSGTAVVDTRVVEAWRRGLLIFENEPLARVVAELNRHRRGKIVLLDAALGALPLDATFRLDRIDEAVPKIAQLFGARVRSLPGGVVFLS